MINIINARNVLFLTTSIAIGYIFVDSISELPTRIVIHPTESFISFYNWLTSTSNSDLQLLDVLEFPLEQQELARQIKENAINTLIESGNYTREELNQPGAILIKYPLVNNLGMNEVYFRN